MQSINPTISVGTPGDDLHLHQKVQMGDRTLVDQPGDSLLIPFMKGLYRLIARANLDNKPNADHDKVHMVDTNSGENYPGQYGDSVGLDTSSVPTLLTVSGTTFDLRYGESYTNERSELSLEGGEAHVFWIESAVPKLNGAFHLETTDFNSNPNQFPLYKVAEWTKDAKPAARTPLDLSGETVDHVTLYNEREEYYRVWMRGLGQNSYMDTNRGPLVYPGIEITRQTRANKMNSYFWGSGLESELSSSGTSRSEATENQNSSTITLSKDYTNNSGSDVTAEAIQIPARIFDKRYAVIARDLNQFTIPDGSTVTVKYEFTATNSGGGLMDIFMQLLKRRFDNGGEVTRVSDGNSVNQNANFWDFYAVPILQRDIYISDDRQVPQNHDLVGPVIGTDDSAVVNTQHSLGSKIENGVQSGQMIHEHVQPSAFRVDKANDECEFDLTRRFVNKSGSDITVRETGVYVSSNYGENYFQEFPRGNNSHMIARNTVGPTTVADGEIIEVTYTFKATL